MPFPAPLTMATLSVRVKRSRIIVPPVRTTFHGLHPDSIAEGLARNRGIVATAMHCVNAIPDVCSAEPGIKTYLDLPLVAGRAAPALLRRNDA
jgi:hypothetical protein